MTFTRFIIGLSSLCIQIDCAFLSFFLSFSVVVKSDDLFVFTLHSLVLHLCRLYFQRLKLSLSFLFTLITSIHVYFTLVPFFT